MKRLLFISSILLGITNLLASIELDVKPAFQVVPHWCWAASCEMVLYAYGETEDQYDCANYAVEGREEVVTMSGKINSVDKVLAWASTGNTIGQNMIKVLFIKSTLPQHLILEDRLLLV
jgi:hypothetical protein